MTDFEPPAPHATAPARYAEVALKLPLHQPFTYEVPAGMDLRVGSRVRVPFRREQLSGIVIALRATCDLEPTKVRPVVKVLDADLPLPEAVLRLAERMVADYGCSLGEALDAALPAAAKRSGVKRIPCLELAIEHERAQVELLELEDQRPEQARVLRAVIEYGAPLPVMLAQRRTNTSNSPWKTLVKHGWLRLRSVVEEGEDWVPAPGTAAKVVELNAEQHHAVQTIVKTVEARAAKTFLLHGVTGSGKTEVYLQVLREVRARGRTAIVLVPEIALTPQTVGRFASRFPDIAVLHSGLTDAQRGKEWRRLAAGRATVAIGARSALFAPVHDLGLIVIDEEHETSFKQDSTPRYHARELAIERAAIENAVVVLGSATPTLESYGRARRGMYELLELKLRAGAGTLPKIVIEDLRQASKTERIDGVQISRRLQVLIEERLNARDQVLLFLNRRGFSPVLICPSCGEVVRCARCDVAMTMHRKRGRLICHYCCDEQRRPECCRKCSHPGMNELGAGTERVAVAVQRLFPSAIVARMDADTMAERGALDRLLTAFRKKQIDVLIGTQMIAKGHDFPDVTLVGVISADTGLFMPDFRAAERTFQLLLQVAGRAGRAEKPGIVVFQTLCPENYAIAAAAKLDYEAFVTQELAYRKQLGYPPFSRLIRVLFEGHDETEAMRKATEVRDTVPDTPQRRTLGPAPAVLPRIQDRHRWHVLIKCFTAEAFADAMERVRRVEDLGHRRLRVVLDVDPVAML